MDAEIVYSLWATMITYVPQKEKADATWQFLNTIDEHEACEMSELKSYVEVYGDYEEEELFSKILKKYIKECHGDDDSDWGCDDY